MYKKMINILILAVIIFLLFPLLINHFKPNEKFLSSKQKGTYSVTLTSPSDLTLLEGKFSLSDCQQSYHFYNELSSKESLNPNRDSQSINLSSGERLVSTTVIFGDLSSLIYENNGICHFFLKIINSKNISYPNLTLEKNINGYILTSTQGFTLRITFLY